MVLILFLRLTLKLHGLSHCLVKGRFWVDVKLLQAWQEVGHRVGTRQVRSNKNRVAFPRHGLRYDICYSYVRDVERLCG